MRDTLVHFGFRNTIPTPILCTLLYQALGNSLLMKQNVISFEYCARSRAWAPSPTSSLCGLVDLLLRIFLFGFPGFARPSLLFLYSFVIFLRWLVGLKLINSYYASSPFSWAATTCAVLGEACSLYLYVFYVRTPFRDGLFVPTYFVLFSWRHCSELYWEILLDLDIPDSFAALYFLRRIYFLFLLLCRRRFSTNRIPVPIIIPLYVLFFS